MKFSSTATIIVLVMACLFIALLLLAFMLGNQYAIFKQSKSSFSSLPSATSTLPETPASTPPPPITLPVAPRNNETGLDKWLTGTVLRAAPLTFGTEVTLALSGETPRGAVTDKNELYLYFVDVVYDSRCPENVDCFAAGEAIVEVQVKASNKPTQTIYLSSATGGKPDRWTYHGLADDSFMTPAIKEEITRGQQRVEDTVYVSGENYKDGGAVVDGYRISLRSLTPNRIHNGDATPPVTKMDYRAGFVVSPVN